MGPVRGAVGWISRRKIRAEFSSGHMPARRLDADLCVALEAGVVRRRPCASRSLRPNLFADAGVGVRQKRRRGGWGARGRGLLLGDSQQTGGRFRRRGSGGEEGRSAQLIVQALTRRTSPTDPGAIGPLASLSSPGPPWGAGFRRRSCAARLVDPLGSLSIGLGGVIRRARLGAPPLRAAPAFSPPDSRPRLFPRWPWVLPRTAPVGRRRLAALPTASAWRGRTRCVPKPLPGQERGFGRFGTPTGPNSTIIGS